MLRHDDFVKFPKIYLWVYKISITFAVAFKVWIVPLRRKQNKTKTDTAMSKICQITGKKAVIGNNVSHSKRRTKRKFDVNLFTKKFYWVEQDQWISLNVSANGLRIINKMGLDAAIKRAAEKGYL